MTPMMALDVCQAAGVGLDRITCAARESHGYLCERTDPHGDDGHRIGQHTIEHAARGNGYACGGRS